MLALRSMQVLCRTVNCSTLLRKYALTTKLHTAGTVACNSTTTPKCTKDQADSNRNRATFGQPVPQTHPHLVKPGEVVTGIQLEEVQNRRRVLLHAMKDYCVKNIDKNIKNHIVIIPSANKKYMSHKIPYVFRQNTDFLYLSGCQEPDSVLVMEIDAEDNCKSTIFVRPKDKHAELWDGPRTGVQLAAEVFGMEQSCDVRLLKEYLSRYSFANPNAITWYDEQASDQEIVSKIIADVTRNQLRSPIELIHNLRVVKSLSECELMRKTCEIASGAINRTMAESYPGIGEHQVFANVDFCTRMSGANFLAYPPVVAGGQNATIIHYVNNNQIVHGGEMILLDAGCEYHGYTSDITRTWPVDGKFTEPQRVLYELLQQVQLELIDCLQSAGGETLDQLFDTMCTKLGKYLQEVKLIPASLSGLELWRAAYKFCPHHVSHYLGMDVHDTPLVSRSILLRPGMVCTVEPGIYISQERTDVPLEFRGLGLRIEDDVLISVDNKVEVLTKTCIKDRSRLEDMLSTRVAPNATIVGKSTSIETH